MICTSVTTTDILQQQSNGKPKLCRCCGEPILPGEELFDDCKTPGFVWSHYICAKEVVINKKNGKPQTNFCKLSICKHWLKSGFCAYGDFCFFAHPNLEQIQKQKKGCNDENQQRNNKTTNPTAQIGRKKRVKCKNESRCAIFRRFLLSRISADRLRQGSGILDVAGGHGELAFQFKFVSGIKSTVVDPRPLLLSKYRRRYTMGLYHKNAAFSKYTVPFVPDLVRKGNSINHVRLFFDNHLFDWLRCNYMVESQRFDWFSNSLKEARSTCWTAKGLGKKEDDSFIFDEEHDKDIGYPEAFMSADLPGDGDIITDAEQATYLFNNASCVVGMHPDQASEYIVDYSLANNIPFALVPCCVYAKEFPKRKLSEGSRVTSYSQFISYLLEKDKRIKQDVLNFEGKNIVLWFDPINEYEKQKDDNILTMNSPQFDAVVNEIKKREGIEI